MLKKIISVLLVMVVIVTACACTTTEKDNTGDSDASNNATNDNDGEITGAESIEVLIDTLKNNAIMSKEGLKVMHPLGVFLLYGSAKEGDYDDFLRKFETEIEGRKLLEEFKNTKYSKIVRVIEEQKFAMRRFYIVVENYDKLSEQETNDFARDWDKYLGSNVLEIYNVDGYWYDKETGDKSLSELKAVIINDDGRFYIYVTRDNMYENFEDQ